MKKKRHPRIKQNEPWNDTAEDSAKLGSRAERATQPNEQTIENILNSE